MKTVILVIGRSGAGKDTIVRELQKKFDIPSVASYTDRPMRPTETNGVEHTFLTKDEFDNVMKKENVVAYTKIGETGYRYCATTELLEKTPSDKLFYIIDPTGYEAIVKSEKFNIVLIYVTASESVRSERANARNGNSVDFRKRKNDEDYQFDEFEKKHWRDMDMAVNNSGSIEKSMNFLEIRLSQRRFKYLNL